MVEKPPSYELTKNEIHELSLPESLVNFVLRCVEGMPQCCVFVG